MKYALMAFLSIVLTGSLISCATLSKKECLEADWYEIGRRDGILGKPRSIFQEHLDACVEYRVTPDREVYYRGRNDGLKIYCTKDNGFEQGRRRRKYNYICPPELEPDFLAGYARGNEIYLYNSKMASLQKRMKRIDGEIKAKEKRLYSSGLSREERAQVHSDIKSLDIQYRKVARELRHLEKTRPISDPPPRSVW